MKPSSIGSALWIATIPVFVFGAWAVYDFKTSNEKIAANAQAAWDSAKIPTPETWLDYRQSTSSAFNFPSELRLVPGSPETAKPMERKPVVGPDIKPLPTKINLAAEATKLVKDLEAQIMLELVVIGTDIRGGIDQQTSMGMFKVKFGVIDEKNRISFTLFPNDKVAANETVWASAGLEKASDIPLILHDCRLVELQEHKAIFAVTTPEFRKLYGAAFEEDAVAAKKAVDENGFVRVTITMEGAAEAAKSLFVSDTEKIVADAAKDGKPDTSATAKNPVDERREAMLKAIKEEEEKRREAQAKALAEIPAETYQDSEGVTHVGRNDLVPTAFDGMEEYGETYLDPETRKPAGVKISRNLPQDSANIIRRYGGKEGDIIKSINGVAVTDSLSIRATVRKMRNDDVDVFNVIYLRDGAEQTKTIKAKKTD